MCVTQEFMSSKIIHVSIFDSLFSFLRIMNGRMIIDQFLEKMQSQNFALSVNGTSAGFRSRLILLQVPVTPIQYSTELSEKLSLI